MTEGSIDKLTATIAPSNATVKTVTWKSDNTSVATVSSSGTITAVAVGTTNISAWASDGSHFAKCTVTVKSKDVNGNGNEGVGEDNLF